MTKKDDLEKITLDCPLMELTGSDLNYNKVICKSQYECEYSIEGVLPNHKEEVVYCWRHMLVKPYKKGDLDER